MSGRWWRWWTAAAACALAGDLASTVWASNRLSAGREVVALGGTLRLGIVTNSGAAFGLGFGHEFVIVLLEVAGLLVLAILALRAQSRVSALGLGLAVGGGLGNLAERLIQPPGVLRGPVID